MIVAAASPGPSYSLRWLRFIDSGKCRAGRSKGLVLGLCQQEKGDAKENADDCGSDEAEQQEIERATDVKLLHWDIAVWRRD
jgi:hypothetical protein